ncbi:hypothetical protein HZH66_012594 [Vespula vulgaris]|uniref:Uncharacterized protein n=1 Tax=Vespula vulgaris TaxID=7454 RepID=A0A834JC45_VESVU|nr:hypothetical protein HZH66_012594 [Vespula vulgaris]
MTIPTNNRIDLNNYQMNYRGNQLRSLEPIYRNENEDNDGENNNESIDVNDNTNYETINLEGLNVIYRSNYDDDSNNNNNNNVEIVPVESDYQNNNLEEDGSTINENRMHAITLLHNMLRRLHASHPNVLQCTCNSVLYDM